MSTKPNILAAVDLDSHATAVIADAARLAALCQGHLVIAHVLDNAWQVEPDQPFAQRPGVARDAMVRHARASLVGMVSHLDLPTDWIEIRVETGNVTQALSEVAGALQPKYCLVGPARLGPFSPSAGLASALKERSDCEVLRVASKRRRDEEGIGAWVRHQLEETLGTPTGQGS